MSTDPPRRRTYELSYNFIIYSSLVLLVWLVLALVYKLLEMKKATRELTLAAFIWHGLYDASYFI